MTTTPEHQNADPIDSETGEYRQDIAERDGDRTKKSGVQINIEETNEASAKVGDIPGPNSFDQTEDGKKRHAEKYGLTKVQREEQNRPGTPVKSTNAQLLKNKNQK